jgi:peptide/nickel transport system ATP-binding protein
MLTIENLRVTFPSGNKTVTPLNAVDMTVGENETFTIIGESGCGKSILANSILRLLPGDARISGRSYFYDTDLLAIPESGLRKIRGRKIGLVFQNTATSIDPVFTVGSQLKEVVKQVNGYMSLEQKLLSLAHKVGIDNPQQRFSQYPHQLSGGMKQRFAVAFGIACDPQLLIADEPTTGLDVSVKLLLLEMLEKVHADRSILLITHDLDVASFISDRVAVMYAGELVEIAPSTAFFNKPLHPYSALLLESHPLRSMTPIPGTAPSLDDIPAGCRFQARCHEAFSLCRHRHPAMVSRPENRSVRRNKYA